MIPRPDSPGRLPPDRMYPAGLPHLRTRRVALRSGETLRVVEGGPDAAPVVALVHGWAASVYTFAEMIEALVAAGKRVVAIDLPGFGLSEPFSDPANYNENSLAEAVVEVLEACGVRRCALVAHSMGGAIAVAVASRSRVLDRLMLIAPVRLGRVPLAVLGRIPSPRFVTRLLQPLLGRGLVRLVLRHLAFGTRERPTRRDIDEYWAPTQFHHYAAACRDCLINVDWAANPAALAALDVPLHVVAGGRDRVVTQVARGGRAVPRATVLEVADAGHLVLQERAPECTAALLKFIASSC